MKLFASDCGVDLDEAEFVVDVVLSGTVWLVGFGADEQANKKEVLAITPATCLNRLLKSNPFQPLISLNPRVHLDAQHG